MKWITREHVKVDRVACADDHEQNAAEWILYDALYAYCQEMVRQGKLDGAFKGADAGGSNPYDRTGPKK